MQLNMQKLDMMAQEWDPTPFLQSIEAAGSMGAFPEEPQGMSYAQMLGQAPGQGLAPQQPLPALPPQMMQQIMGSMQQQQGAPVAPAAPMSKPGMIEFPSAAVPRGAKPVPQLSQLIGGR